MLYAYVTPENFKASPYSSMHKKRRRILKLDAKNHRVLYNDNGECSAEQFGSLRIAVAKYKEIKDTCLS